jgi:hypothetical protein
MVFSSFLAFLIGRWKLVEQIVEAGWDSSVNINNNNNHNDSSNKDII